MPLETQQLLEKAREVIQSVNPNAIIDENSDRGEVTFHVHKRWIVPIIRALRSDAGLQMNWLSDITAIDYLNVDRLPRFDVVYHLYSLSNYHRVRLKVPVEEDESTIDSVCELWSGANFMEREVYDMFGISFAGHPDLRRILMPDNWEGHPLRKDFPIGGSKSFYYKKDSNEYAGEPDDLVPRIRVQDSDI